MVRTGLASTLFLALVLAGPIAVGRGQQAEVPAKAVRVEGEAPKAADDKDRPAGAGKVSLLGLVRGANPMLWPLALCSVVAVGYTLERLIALRRGRVIPRDFVDRFQERLAAGKLDRERAIELCKANDSPVARVFLSAVKSWGQPGGTIRMGVAQDAGVVLADLRRNVRALNGTATLAPLLGLLGTVIGMIESFDALGGRTAAGTAKSEALAHGISLALMSTAVGLAVAVVSVAAYYYLLGRVDLLVRDLDDQASTVVDQISAEALRPTGPRPSVDYSRHA